MAKAAISKVGLDGCGIGIDFLVEFGNGFIVWFPNNGIDGGEGKMEGFVGGSRHGRRGRDRRSYAAVARSIKK